MSLEKRNRLCVNSFPRTGNTYLQQSIELFIKKNNLNHISFNSHTHDHLLLLNNNISQVTVLRNPMDTITSLILMFINPNNSVDEIFKELDYLIDEELKLYMLFLSNINDYDYLAVLKFDDLINSNINEIIYKIFNYLNIDINNEPILITENDINQNINNNIKKHNGNLYALNYPKDKNLIPERGLIMQKIKVSRYFNDAIKIYNNKSTNLNNLLF